VHADRAARSDALILILGVLAFGLAAALLGQSNNWDLRNYHWYDGWAWLEGRTGVDLAAAQAQTWFNPLLPALLYLLLSSVKPWLGTFLLGAIQGLHLLPLQRIARHLLPERRYLVLLVAFVGVTGATQRGELGATFGDNLVSLPLLCALTLLVVSSSATSMRRVALAGALLGLAVGLKLTAAPAAAGIACAGLWLLAQRGQRLWHGAVLAGCAAAVFLLVNGHWMWHLRQEFGNPLFPMFGAVFGGEFAVPVELRDTRWLPRDALQWLFYPLTWADQPRQVSELWFLDLRVPLWFIAMLAVPFWWRRARSQSAQPQALACVVIATALIYLFWLVLFGYYRYLVVLEMLAPLLLAIALLAAAQRGSLVILCSVLVVIGLATRGPRWGRVPTYAAHYVEVQLPPLAQQRDGLVLFADHEPLAFLAPAFPSGTRFARVLGNLIGPPIPEWGLDRAVRARLRAHRGPLLLLAARLDDPLLPEALQRQALELDRDSCARIDSNVLDRRDPPPQLCTVRLLETPPSSR
jgi:hypothetical protein